MKKPRLGTNELGTDDRGDEQGFFDSGLLVMRGTPITGATYHYRACHRTWHFVSVLQGRWTLRVDP
jgi:hypothetical protein